MSANNCHNCSYCKSVAAVEVTGDEHAIKREFERIERTSQSKKKVTRKQKAHQRELMGFRCF